MPDLETEDEDQESVNGMPNSKAQDDDIIDFMHNISILTFPDEVIRVNKQTGQILHIVLRPIEPTIPQLESWDVPDNGTSEAFNMYEANDIWVQHGLDQRVNTCIRMFCLQKVGLFLEYIIAYSRDSECSSMP